MADVAEEIQGNWTSVRIINTASHTEFTNDAVNVPYLNVIQSLDLSRVGKLTLSDEGFRDYDSLKNLDISATELSTIKSSWFSKKTIETINLSENELQELKKESMKFFPQLRVFNASFNQIKTLEAKTFAESKKIEVIVLSHNRLVNVVFDDLQNLRQLYLEGNLIVTIWVWTFARMPKLQIINLAENAITGVVDRSFTALESLKYLNLSDNKIPYIGPWSFAGGSKIELETIDLSYNSITIMYPISLHEMIHALSLDLSFNKISEIYEKNFLKTTNLQMLNLQDNQIKKIAPKSFAKLTQLMTLDLSNNKLENFDVTLFDGNSFEDNRLRKLNLRNNLIKNVNKELFLLFNFLNNLDISENKLKTIPDDFLKTNKYLMSLNVASNQIEFFPSNFFTSLTFLKEFDVHNNQINYLPSMMDLDRLQSLKIGKNPWQCACLREFIAWTRVNDIELDKFNFNPPFPSCVVTTEMKCIKDFPLVDPDIKMKFNDGVSLVEMEVGRL
ncbi:CLUMA_CG013400, isoform A [Clunio marinus]|uniref:CLUMA_CG013400, isoform A n=1 Tax=Clunio marinus TaxID=568069 RepID=A0A1J1IIV0_9DIPT|nr:CLUMA_CG013400, isoform A [Clunio marinus]